MQKMPAPRSTGRFEEHAADTVMLLALTLARRDSDDAVSTQPTTIADKTLGLVGFDRTARAVVRRAAQGFGMRVLVQGASDSDRMIAIQLGAEISPSLDHLLLEADIVSLHGRPSGGAIHGDGATHGGRATPCGGATIDAHRLNQMKPDACLINIAHGDLVDEQALLHALWFETIGGAGIAVAEETLDRSSYFRACANAILLEGAREVAQASDTKPAQNMPSDPAMIADNVIDLFRGEQRHAW